jgi:hypothetical protein
MRRHAYRIENNPQPVSIWSGERSAVFGLAGNAVLIALFGRFDADLGLG